jgi:hypothetical protein
MPFKQAATNDPFYSYVVKNDYEGYWNKRALKMKLSDNFKSLFFNIIANDYAQRPSIDEIRQTEWMKEGMSEEHKILYNEVSLKSEFAKRKQIVDFKRMKERQKKEDEKINNTNKVTFGKVYRSFEMKNNLPMEKEFNRKMEDYIECGNNYTLVFSKDGKYNEKNVFKMLDEFFKEKKAEVKLSEEKFSMKVSFGENEDYIENLVEEKEDVINNEDFLHMNEFKLQVDIKSNEDKFIVEFIKKSNDRFGFYKIYEDFEKILN